MPGILAVRYRYVLAWDEASYQYGKWTAIACQILSAYFNLAVLAVDIQCNCLRRCKAARDKRVDVFWTVADDIINTIDNHLWRVNHPAPGRFGVPVLAFGVRGFTKNIVKNIIPIINMQSERDNIITRG